MEIFDFASCDRLKQLYDLLFHFLVIHDEDVLSSTFDRASPYHVKADSIANAYRVSNGNIILFHVSDYLDNFLSIKDLTISNQNHIPYILMHLFLNFDDIEQRISDFSSAKISIEIFNLFDRLLHITIVILDTSLKHPLKFAPEADNVEDRAFGKRLKEQDQ